MKVARLIIIVLALGLSGAASANGPEIGFSAGGIFPLASTQVRLVEEFVTVPIEGGAVHCQYTLKNLDEAPASVTMGFVTNAPWPRPDNPYGAQYRAAHFEVIRDGRSLPVRLEALDKDTWTSFMTVPPDSLPVWTLDFAPREKVRLSIRYDVLPSGGCDGSHCSLDMTYYAATARLWAGEVGYARIQFTFGRVAAILRQGIPDCSPYFRLEASPPFHRETPGGIAWEYRDWEPDTDFKVRIDWTDSN
jgi:hypothetical protein